MTAYSHTNCVISGAGAVASVGADTADIFGALCAGRSGLATLRGFEPASFRVRHAYEIDDRPGPGADIPLRATGWLCQAIEAAIKEAGLDGDLRDVPVLVGTGLRELRSLELWWRDRAGFDLRDLDFDRALATRFGVAASYTFANACSASLYALALAQDLLTLGLADTIVVAGTDSISASMFGLLDRVHPVPPDALRPFDRDRAGVLLGEGAAAVVVQRDQPGLAARAVLRSVAVNCDAYHVTAPDPAGIAAAMRDAHTRAGIEPAEVDVVFAHGTGTMLNDEAEASALSEVFAPGEAGPLVTAIKSMTGHTSGGSGLLGLVVAAESLAHGLVPPTAGLEHPITEATGLRLVREAAHPADLSLAQVDAFGFGGVNAVAVLGKPAQAGPSEAA